MSTEPGSDKLTSRKICSRVKNKSAGFASRVTKQIHRIRRGSLRRRRGVCESACLEVTLVQSSATKNLCRGGRGGRREEAMNDWPLISERK